MSSFSSMLHALALAVQTLADGGGPFWEPETAPRAGTDQSKPPAGMESQPVLLKDTCKPVPKK